MYKGIVLAGTWIVDHIKFIDYYPKKGYLSYIRRESIGLGGGPHNVGINLRKIDPNLALFALGKIGEDEGGRRILEKLSEERIDLSWVTKTSSVPTSYTDVMTEIKTGMRTFFHHQGANALLTISDFPIKKLKGKLLYLGYLMALPSLDKKDPEYGSVAARLFHYLKENNIDIAVDLVSMEDGDMKKSVFPTLKYVDYFIINELEAEKLTNIKIIENEKLNVNKVIEALKYIKTQGKMKYIVIHFPQGAIGMTKEGDVIIQPSLLIPDKDIINTLGAGDAFFAGVLYGIMKGMNLKKSMKLGVELAGACLFWETTTWDKDITLSYLENLGVKYGFRTLKT